MKIFRKLLAITPFFLLWGCPPAQNGIIRVSVPQWVYTPAGMPCIATVSGTKYYQTKSLQKSSTTEYSVPAGSYSCSYTCSVDKSVKSKTVSVRSNTTINVTLSGCPNPPLLGMSDPASGPPLEFGFEMDNQMAKQNSVPQIARESGAKFGNIPVNWASIQPSINSPLDWTTDGHWGASLTKIIDNYSSNPIFPKYVPRLHADAPWGVSGNYEEFWKEYERNKPAGFEIGKFLSTTAKQKWLGFASALAKRYRNVAPYIRIENEPGFSFYQYRTSTSSPWQWNSAAKNFVQELKETNLAIKNSTKGNPSAKTVITTTLSGVMNEGMGSVDMDPRFHDANLYNLKDQYKELKAVLDLGGGSSFDVLDIHFYGQIFQDSSNNENWSWINQTTESIQFETYVSNLKNLLANKGLNKPLWLTETGYSTGPALPAAHMNYDSWLRYQAEHIIKMHSMAFGVGINHVHWLFLRDKEWGQRSISGNAADPGYRCGMIRDWRCIGLMTGDLPSNHPVDNDSIKKTQDGEVVPYEVYQRYTQNMAGRWAAGSTTTSDGIKVYRFRGSSSDILVVWNSKFTTPESKTVSLHLAPYRQLVRVENSITGDRVYGYQLDTGDGLALRNLSISRTQPLYIEVKR